MTTLCETFRKHGTGDRTSFPSLLFTALLSQASSPSSYLRDIYHISAYYFQSLLHLTRVYLVSPVQPPYYHLPFLPRQRPDRTFHASILQPLPNYYSTALAILFLAIFSLQYGHSISPANLSHDDLFQKFVVAMFPTLHFHILSSPTSGCSPLAHSSPLYLF